ncbi:hypothetical protein V6L77_07830 [Pannonibacter sp. Pt2-lr]
MGALGVFATVADCNGDTSGNPGLGITSTGFDGQHGAARAGTGLQLAGLAAAGFRCGSPMLSTMSSTTAGQRLSRS